MKNLIPGWAVALVLAPLVPGLAACGAVELTEPHAQGVPESELTFLRFGTVPNSTDDAGATTSDVPRASLAETTLLQTDTSFVATRGEPLLVELFYEPESDDEDVGDRFLRFELDATTLSRYPPDHPMEGTAFASGDTVTISIRASTDTLLAKFAPAGLEFDSDAPAELEVSYLHAEYDPDLEEEIDLWKQESEGEPWYNVGEIQHLDIDVIQATLTSFTRYAMAI